MTLLHLLWAQMRMIQRYRFLIDGAKSAAPGVDPLLSLVNVCYLAANLFTDLRISVGRALVGLAERPVLAGNPCCTARIVNRQFEVLKDIGS